MQEKARRSCIALGAALFGRTVLLLKLFTIKEQACISFKGRISHPAQR